MRGVRRHTTTPMPAPYRVLYTVWAHPPFLVSLLGLAGLGGIVAGKRWLNSLRRSTAHDLLSATLAPAALMFVGMAFAIFGLGFGLGTWVYLSTRFALGAFTTVEGAIHEFHPGDPDGHREESWQVATPAGTFTFTYSPSTVLAGYAAPTPPGGPLHDGAQVRVAQIHGRIARLEVLEEGSQ